MTEAIVTGVSAAASNAAGLAARPRVSAASFRDLTARLRKADIPAFTPVIVPQPPPVAAVEMTPPQRGPLADEPPASLQAEPIFAPPQPDLQAHAPPPVPPPEASATVEPEPQAAAPQEPLVETFETGTVEQEAPQDEPHAGLQTIDVKPDAANEALREQVKSRQIRAELDLIWRMLLAQPSAEERSAYLREAAEVMGTEPVVELPPAPPEHDLSVIAPAAGPDETGAAEAEEPAFAEPAAAPLDDMAAAETSELARSLLDMMASGASTGLPQERALAADTLLRLVPKLDVKSLVMLSQRVARMDNPPPLIVARLLRDPRVEVSGPLLEDCPQITDRDLETVIAERDPARLRMIARRRGLGPATTDSLIQSGDASVLLTLVRNAECEISQDGFRALIAAAGANLDLLAPLCTRADMSAPMAFELFWHAPAQLRRFILSRFLTDSETLTKILRITLSTNEDDKIGEQEISLQHAVVEALERAARGRLEAAAADMGAALKIDKGTALRVLRDKQGEPLIVLLKTAGYPRQALSGLLGRFKDPEIGIIDPERELDELVSIFETLSFNKARILLTYWDWSQRGTGPYAPLD